MTLKTYFKNHHVRRIALMIFIGHTVFFAIQIPQVYIFGAQGEDGFQWIMIARLACGSLIAMLQTPFILWFGCVLPIGRQHLYRNLAIHFLLGVTAGVIQHFGYSLALITFNLTTTESFYANWLNPKVIIPFVPSTVVRYAGIIAIQQAFLHFRKSQERAVLLREAELEILKMQLHPHFFFNTLNAIAGLNYQSPKEANRLIMQLGDMFRIALRKDKLQEISLREELKFLETFLQIHKTMMGERLRIEWQIDPATLDAAVPNLVLQPLVENAIQHGLALLEAGGLIRICAEKIHGKLILTISNDGRGLASKDEVKESGIGLSNVRRRLANLYQDSHRFSIVEEKDGAGVSVKIEIPFREKT